MVELNFSYIPCSRCGIYTAVDTLKYAGKGRYFCSSCSELTHGGACVNCNEYDCMGAICCLDGKHRDETNQCTYTEQARIKLIEKLIDVYVKE